MLRRTVASAAILLLALPVIAYAGTAGGSAAAEPQRRPAQRRTQRRPTQRRPAQRRPRVDYTNFSHETRQHRGECRTCHTIPTSNWRQARDGAHAFPDVTNYPDHDSCVNCHRQQFFRGARPEICTICHTVVSPRTRARDVFPFQNPAARFVTSAKYARLEARDRTRSDFRIVFPHDVHQDALALYRPAHDRPGGARVIPASFAPQEEARRSVDLCVVCHETVNMGSDESGYVTKPAAELGENKLKIKQFWLRPGAFKSEPSSHASCFSCHWSQGGVKPLANDCNGCHALPQSARNAAVSRDEGGDSPTPDVARQMGLVAGKVSNPELTARGVMNLWADRQVGAFWHEQKSHAGTACTSCHVDMKDRPQYIPIKTCASSSCHGGTSTRRGLYIAAIYVEVKEKEKNPTYQCTYCHINNGARPAPDSHRKLF